MKRQLLLLLTVLLLTGCRTDITEDIPQEKFRTLSQTDCDESAVMPEMSDTAADEENISEPRKEETEPSETPVFTADGEYSLTDGTWTYTDPQDNAQTPMPFIPSDAESVQAVLTDDNRVLGFAVQNGDNLYAYYSLDAEDYLTGYEWSYIHTRTASANYIIVNRNEDNPYSFMSGILHTGTGKISGFDRTHGKVGLSIMTNGDAVFFITSDTYDTSGYNYIYTEDMQLLAEEPFSHASVTADGTLLAIPAVNGICDNVFRIYSKTGELLKTSAEYDEVLFVCRDWIYAVEDGMLCLFDTDENCILEFAPWSENMTVHWMLSGYKNESPAQTDGVDPYKYYYYERNEAGEYVGKETDTYPEGLYFLTEDNSMDYGMVGRAKEYFCNPVTGLVGMLAWGEIGGYAKPVLYLYPEEETEVTVRFARPELLTTVYPAYTDSWQVTAAPDGTLTDAREREYYALYWEESGTISVDFTTGFCVAQKDAAAFLEEKLDCLGLTNREANEMIMYWLPVLERNRYSLVYFELTESREAYNHLRITPEPDSLLRIAIHIRASDEYVQMDEQQLPAWERSGFSAVEWGGVTHP